MGMLVKISVVFCSSFKHRIYGNLRWSINALAWIWHTAAIKIGWSGPRGRRPYQNMQNTVAARAVRMLAENAAKTIRLSTSGKWTRQSKTRGQITSAASAMKSTVLWFPQKISIMRRQRRALVFCGGMREKSSQVVAIMPPR